MLGKQWLNRYASTDLRGTAIERSQNRQRKLDGIIGWYFDYVMESLPLMLQTALLLLGCALSRYLWDINITIASVVIGVTSFGFIFYLSIVIAGTASESCPYQTPGARIFRYVLPRILRALRSAPSVIFAFVSKFFSFIQASALCDLPFFWWSNLERPWYSMGNIIINLLFTLLIIPPLLPVAIVIDALNFGLAIYWSLVAFGRMVYHLFVGTSPQTHIMDLKCISWMLQTSLDKSVHLSTLKHLESLIALPTNLDPALIGYCFNAFVGCISASDGGVTVTQGLEQLAMASALCLFHTVSHLSILDPTSSVLKDISQRYAKVFPAEIVFRGHEFSHTMNAVHRVFIRSVERHNFTWGSYKPPSDEYTLVSGTLVKLAQFGHRMTPQKKVPRLILRFALYSLSQDPPPPTPIIADCLSIIATDLDCDVPFTETAALDEKCVRPSRIVTDLTLELAHGWSRSQT